MLRSPSTGLRTSTIVLATLALAVCDSPSSSYWDDPSPPPTVETSLDAGPIPVIGQLALAPDPTASDWSYAVDLDGDGDDDATGDLRERVKLPYRFETHGVHSIRVVFTRPPGGRVEIVEPVVAFDPDHIPGLRILARRHLPVDEGDSFYEGIAVGPLGSDVYVGSYIRGVLYRLDPESLEARDSVEIDWSLEGLAVGPTGNTLLAIHKSNGLDVLDPSTLEPRAHYDTTRGFFVSFLDAGSAIAGGDGLLNRIDLATGEATATLHDSDGLVDARHFGLSPDGGSVAVAGQDGAVRIADVSTLTVERTLSPEEMEVPRAVAYHPDGDRLYVVVERPDPQRLLVMDVASGSVRSSEILEPESCSGFCVANPVATSRAGTWIVFAETAGAYVVDTRTDRVALRIEEPLGSGVAASTVDDEVFYFVDTRGVVTKVRLRP